MSYVAAVSSQPLFPRYKLPISRSKPSRWGSAVAYPPLVPRGLAADFALLTTRTLLRAEKLGLLHPVKRNLRTVSYHKSELLEYLGITEEVKA